MSKPIPITVKKTCLEMHEKGFNSKDIYDQYFAKETQKQQSYSSFRRSLQRWKKAIFPDTTTLDGGTYEGFTAHGATVQVNASGEIERAWIKQHADDFDPADFLEAIQDSIESYDYEPHVYSDAEDMLEIPLFDMHWGLAFFEFYRPVLNEVIEIISSKHWRQIVIPLGQDFFHNDSIVKGETTKGTQIERVDMQRAVKEGLKFIYAIVDLALLQADEVRILYTPGNHDQSISWMLMQVLLERYGPGVVDDSMAFRKVITYGKNAIMVTHGNSKKATHQNLAHIFPISFPTEFGEASIREVHAGHLHSESDSDIYGVMVRRLAANNVTDEWTDKEDYVGTHKRFMLFIWSLDKLRDIHYI